MIQLQIQNLIFEAGLATGVGSGGGPPGPGVDDRVFEDGDPVLTESSEQRIIE